MKLEDYLDEVPENFTKLAALPGWARAAGGFLKQRALPLGAGAGIGAGAGVGGTMLATQDEDPGDVPAGMDWSAVAGKALGGAGAAALGAGALGLGHMAYQGLRRASQSGEHGAVLEQVVAADPLLQEANPEDLEMQFATMTKFAPTLSTDPHAVQSFLREAVTSGGGINYNTIKLLSEAERVAQEIA